MELYISPLGNDAWSGQHAEPNAGRTDGPLATLEGARRKLRALRAPDAHHNNLSASIGGLEWPVTVWLRGGVYPTTQPVSFTSEDSAPITFKAYPDEIPILDGGVQLHSWRIETVNDRTIWKAPWNATLDGRQLWVDGKRATRSRWPKAGLLKIADPLNSQGHGWGDSGSSQFIVNPADWGDIRNISGVDAIALHFWLEERMPLTSYEAVTGLVTSSRSSLAPLNEAGQQDGARYYLENVRETLSEPGEWAYCPDQREVYYIPYPGQTPENTEVYAARSPQLLELRGDADNGRYVEWLRFEGLHFRHTAAIIPGDETWPESLIHSDDPYYRGAHLATAHQAAVDVPGVVRWSGARNCAFINCSVEHAGWYGLELGAGCSSNRIEHNTFSDLGAGGIHIFGREIMSRNTSNNRITDNEIHSYGQVFASAVGIVIRHSGGNLIAHNHVHHGSYTAISVGWTWSFARNLSFDNLIEWNHVHDIGRGVLSDMGGIYLLGVAPGTIVRHNLIHDVECLNHGGWGIYADEGSSHLVIEKNLCYNLSSSVFHQHWGRENTIRNNVFAFGKEAVVTLSKTTEFIGATFSHNLLLAHGTPIYLGGYEHDITGPGAFLMDVNLCWDFARDLTHSSGVASNTGDTPTSLTWEVWQASGCDTHSIAADPQLQLPFSRQIELKPDSPALSIGFQPFDLKDVGPRRIRFNQEQV